jgi:hypothetical protein
LGNSAPIGAGWLQSRRFRILQKTQVFNFKKKMGVTRFNFASIKIFSKFFKLKKKWP